jgi:hypothetical protein
MTDFRALCDELLEALYYETGATSGDWTMLRAKAEAALAQPEPQGPTDEELTDTFYGDCRDTVTGLRAVLSRWGRPAIEPVPVAERLPGPEDCDAEGRCWWLKQAANPEHDLLTPTWHLQRHGPAGSTFFKFTHWLPHHALPVPQQEANND